MKEYSDFYTVRANALSRPELKNLPLLITFGHPNDAGNTAIGLADCLLDKLENITLVEFDSDEFHDYRLRRPPIHFNGDRFETPTFPKLELYVLEDELGRHFLLLAGVEPDLRWRKFTSAILEIVEELEISLAIFVTGFPTGVPHTRKLPVTPHGTRTDLFEGVTQHKLVMDVPSSVSSVLASRMADADIDTVGFAVHVPQYLSEAELPHAALAALEHVVRVTRLSLPTDSLLEDVVAANKHIGRQVQANPEIADMVQKLEEHYDRNMADHLTPKQSFDAQELDSIPHKDEIARVIENYLSTLPEKDTEAEDGRRGLSSPENEN